MSLITSVSKSWKMCFQWCSFLPHFFSMHVLQWSFGCFGYVGLVQDMHHVQVGWVPKQFIPHLNNTEPSTNCTSIYKVPALIYYLISNHMLSGKFPWHVFWESILIWELRSSQNSIGYHRSVETFWCKWSKYWHYLRSWALWVSTYSMLHYYGLIADVPVRQQTHPHQLMII